MRTTAFAFAAALAAGCGRPATPPTAPPVVRAAPPPPKQDEPPLPPGVVHVADAYAAIDALAANDLGNDWWHGTVRGVVVLVEPGNPGQARVIIADLRRATTNTVTVLCDAKAAERLKRGEVVTAKGRGRQRDFYAAGSVYLDNATLLPDGG